MEENDVFLAIEENCYLDDKWLKESENNKERS